MPKSKLRIYIASVVLLSALAILSTVMLYPRFQKSTEQLPELIEQGTTNEALLQIKAQLDAASAAVGYNEETGLTTVMWNGSVCAARYQTLSGEQETYYVCPYILAETSDVSDTEAEWTFSLRFAVSALKNGALSSIGNRISVEDINFNFRVLNGLKIAYVAYGDGDMNAVNGTSVSYTFRDRSSVNEQTSIPAKLRIAPESADSSQSSSARPFTGLSSTNTSKNTTSYIENTGIRNIAEILAHEREEEQNASEESAAEPETTADHSGKYAVLDWTFTIYENRRIIGQFDDVEMEFPYFVNEAGVLQYQE